MRLSRRELAKGWTMEERSTVPCAVAPDGLLVMFDLKDVEATLDTNHPWFKRFGEKVWWFNQSKDREMAEQDGDRVVANPQVLWNYFLKK